MNAFEDFLSERLVNGGFSTEDLLVSFLPLLRQVIDEHDNGWCAPLEGLRALHVEDARIWYPESTRVAPMDNSKKLKQIDRAQTRAVDVLKQHRFDGTGEEETSTDLETAEREEQISRPVYLPGYVAWEHQVGHHDPLSDVYSLGMILAAMGCCLDLNDPEALQQFVDRRENLFKLAPHLHPVVAKAIVRMTELSRHKRVQNLPGILASLENYRDQELDIEYNLARIKGFENSDPQTRQQIILHHLNERLFEISRRNRLLHFRRTMHTINLTEASVPLSFSLEHIRPDHLLTWSSDFRNDLRAGKTVSLNRYLDFNEILYLPGVLDRIRGEARRDQSEYGFEQLRLVICFLNWANLKETPHEQYHSPLILLPVRLNKKKGIRDTFTLEPLSDHAEINPVIRHQFKQLYDIDLPESLDLGETDIDTFFDYLHRCVTASAPGITLDKIDRPRIDMVYDHAKRRLESYRRRARLSGRGIRHYMDLDYSYDRANFHPLAIRLFSEYIRPSETGMDQIISDKPAPRHMVSGESLPPNEKSFYSLRTDEGGNPWNWEFDLCNVTLGNFRYRKMTLVRDYAELQQNPLPNQAFEATFSFTPQDIDFEDDETTPELEDRYHVVSCDPTQARAIALAQSGTSYIIQGPPGTGKSQTITNLIADYIARGKRVLFVCEKRAAIDVVYLRLKQCGLEDLCCLIHDSQADKKSFVMDLKKCYEGLLNQAGNSGLYKNRRKRLIKMLRNELRPIRRFTDAMLDHPEACGAELRIVLAKALALRDQCPDLSAIEREALPQYSVWLEHRQHIEDMVNTLRDIQPDGILAHHPLRRLSPAITTIERPLEHITGQLGSVQEALPQLVSALSTLPLPENDCQTFSAVQGLIAYAKKVAPLAELQLLSLLNSESETNVRFRGDATKRSALARQLAEREAANANWQNKLDARETEWALQLAEAVPGNIFKIFSSKWWKLRGVLKSAYNFSAHQIPPDWTIILNDLAAEHDATDELMQWDKHIEERFNITSSVEEIINQIEVIEQWIKSAPESAINLHAEVLASPSSAAATVDTLLQAAPAADRMERAMNSVLSDYEPLSLKEIETDCGRILDSLNELPEFLTCLAELSKIDPNLSKALRNMPLTAEQIEAAIIERSVEESMRSDRRIQRYSEKTLSRQIGRIEGMIKKLAELNAETARETVQGNFLDHMRIATMPAAGMSPEEKELKEHFNLGRRELEHEFGKSMRYKSIRDLVADDSGRVVRDLKPVWLMSPLSVSDTLPLNDSEFDVVIFDEASQITLEEAIPSIFRAKQAIVVGDEMQLPPTNFFSAKRSEEEEVLYLEEGGQTIEYDLDSNSFLNYTTRNLQSRMLGWHYRSRSESLISFSNWAFYQGGLLTVPEEQLPASQQDELMAQTPEDADEALEPMLERAVSFHFMENGIYEKRCNRMEADYIARLVRGLLVEKKDLSIGIVAFSEAQQGEISSALTRLAREDRKFGNLLEAELEREVDGQFVGLLVKNLENIQGDERDIVIMSVCYGHDKERRMRMNFGPINQSGGEKRLNVAFSRAKHHMVLVSSIRHSHITNDYNDGANCLKNYLRYAELSSMGDSENATRILRELSLWSNQTPTHANRKPDVVVHQIAAALRERGWLVDTDIGMSHFRCDLGVREENATAYSLGIQVDTDDYYAQDDLIERDLMKPSLLRAFGWRIAQVLACDWFRDREGVLARLEKLIKNKDHPEEKVESSLDLDALLAEAETAELETPSPDIPESTTSEPGTLTEGQTLRLESHTKSSDRFWEITWVSDEYSLRYGRIGSNGQSRTKTFETQETAQREAEKMIRQKLRKGYQQT